MRGHGRMRFPHLVLPCGFLFLMGGYHLAAVCQFPLSITFFLQVDGRQLNPVYTLALETKYGSPEYYILRKCSFRYHRIFRGTIKFDGVCNIVDLVFKNFARWGKYQKRNAGGC